MRIKPTVNIYRVVILAIVALMLFAHQAKAQDRPLPNSSVARVKAYFESVIGARYMEKQCNPITYPGWEGLPLIECTYSVKGARDKAPKTAKVIMLNPSPDQIARWVVSTCLEIKGNANPRCTSRLSRHIIGQSGAQFPIAGIVFEDLIPRDGVFEVYVFRNGVTVRIDGINHRGTSQPSEDEIRKSISGDLISTGKFARLQSTTREQYKRNGGKVDVGTTSKRKATWLDVTRDLYKAAWGSDHNELMLAWARANVKKL